MKGKNHTQKIDFMITLQANICFSFFCFCTKTKQNKIISNMFNI